MLAEDNEPNLADTVALLTKLSLDDLDDNWVLDVWNSQFTEVADLPDEYEEHILARLNVPRLLEQVADLALKWISNHSDVDLESSRGEAARSSFNDSSAAASNKSGGYWTSLMERGIKYKKLIALIFYFLERGLKLEASGGERELCLRSASLYFVLLAMPGSGAFKIFDAVLYNKSLGTFKLALKLHLVRLSPKKKKKKQQLPKHGQKSQASQGSIASSQSSRPRKRHSSRASSVNSIQFNEEDFEDSDEDLSLTPEEVQSLTISLNKVVFHFLTLLDHFSLKRSAESLEVSVQELVELTHLETVFASLDFGRKQKRSGLTALAFNAYIGLEKLCQPLHGNVGRTVQLIFKFLLPGVLMIHRGASEISPKGLTVIREHTIHFVKHLMRRVGNETHEAAEIFIQHLALQVPERAEPRAKASQAIVDLMRELPSPLFKRIIRWLFRWAHNEKVSHRQFAVEVMGKLLHESERAPDDLEALPEGQEAAAVGCGDEEEHAAEDGESESESKEEEDEAGDRRRRVTVDAKTASSDNEDMVSHRFIFGVIFSRCRDVAATVRAKALQTLAEITASNNPTMAIVIKDMFNNDQGSSTAKKKSESGLIDFVELLEESEDVDLTEIDPLPSADAFLDFLRKRALDDSVYVRKNALQVLENILKFSDSALSGDLISILAEHCRDSSLMIRKQMINSLTELVRKYPGNEVVIQHWVEGIFPLILDVEQKSSEKALECVWECLFSNLVKYSAASRVVHFLPWVIMQQTQQRQMTKYLSRACSTWAKEGRLKSDVLNVLKTHVHTENNDHAWLLLSLVTAHLPLLDPHFVMEYFMTSIHTPEGVGLYTLLQVLRVLFASVVRLTQSEQTLLRKDLVLLVQRFSIPPELISTAVDIATVVSSIEAGEGNIKQYQSNVDGWAVQIIETIDKDLTEKILTPKGPEVENMKMMRQIFTLGELAQICPKRINNRLFLLMQSIIFQQGSKHRRSKKAAEVNIPSSQTQSTEPPPCAFTPTTKLQALAIVALAKMCIQHEDMAKKIVPAFGRLLDTSNDVSIKNNVMYALTDMCVRYASLVDPLIPQITACLKDSTLVVRRTTLITLIHLLQEDYLKMSGRGAFFFRILQTLCDESDEIRQLTTFYLQQRLLKRQPKVMYQHFIESIFHFNEYEGHQKYNKFLVSDREKRLFSMKGADNRDSRTKLYKFMLENMIDEERFQTTFKLCQDVLNGVVEGHVKLDEKSHGLLQDTFACLSSEEIKLASLKSKQDEDEGVTEEDMMGALAVEAKKTIISQVVKKNVIENIIPIIIALKHKLENEKSALIDDLMTYLRELMKDYKNEVKELLSADKQLATEIEFDLRKWEEEQRKLESRRETLVPEPSLNAQRNKEAVQVFLETAVNAMKEQMEARRRESVDGLISEEGENIVPASPFHTFLASNHALDGDNIPDSLPTMLSPLVVLEKIQSKDLRGTPKSKKAVRKSLLGEFAKKKKSSLPVVEEESLVVAGRDAETAETGDDITKNDEIESSSSTGKETEVPGENVEKEAKEDCSLKSPDHDAVETGAKEDRSVDDCTSSDQEEAKLDSSMQNKSSSVPHEESGNKSTVSIHEEEEEVKEPSKGPQGQTDVETKTSGDESSSSRRKGKRKHQSEAEEDVVRPSGSKRKPQDEAQEDVRPNESKRKHETQMDVRPSGSKNKSRKENDDSLNSSRKSRRKEKNESVIATPPTRETRKQQQQQQQDQGNPKTKVKTAAARRAISTPNKDETMLARNVTFLERSHELSAIPLLSPPSPKKRAVRGQEKPADSSDVSFRFRKDRRPDMFEELMRKDIENRKASTKKGATPSPKRRDKAEPKAVPSPRSSERNRGKSSKK